MCDRSRQLAICSVNVLLNETVLCVSYDSLRCSLYLYRRKNKEIEIRYKLTQVSKLRD